MTCFVPILILFCALLRSSSRCNYLHCIWRDDLVGLFTGMAFGYFVLVLLYGAIVLTSDWQHYGDLAVQRAEMK